MFKFIHAADVHMDSPLRGLERYEGAPVQRIRDASRIALENLVTLAIQEKVAFVLIAGDIMGTRHFYERSRFPVTLWGHDTFMSGLDFLNLDLRYYRHGLLAKLVTFLYFVSNHLR